MPETALHQGIFIVRVVPQGPHLRARGQQGIEAPLGFNPALLQHDDVVGTAQGGTTV